MESIISLAYLIACGNNDELFMVLIGMGIHMDVFDEKMDHIMKLLYIKNLLF